MTKIFIRDELFTRFFPEEFSNDAAAAARCFPGDVFMADAFCRYRLLSGEDIILPYRIYGADGMEAPSGLSPVQVLIFHAFLSRSHNGFIREKHLRELLKSEVPEWLFPYILKLSDEYVVPILELIYAYWKNRNCEKIKEFCRLNRSSFVRSYDRMASYWGAGYGPFHQYVGRKLFLECYGYQKSLWHGQEPQKQRKYCGAESLNED